MIRKKKTYISKVITKIKIPQRFSAWDNMKEKIEWNKTHFTMIWSERNRE